MSKDTSAVLFEELNTESGFKIAHATLNKPASLNALGLDMIELLTPQLEAWQQDEKVALVVLDGSGDRAFCAGGDIVSMYHSMQSAQNKTDDFSLQAFFSLEYHLDHLIHTFSKPILVWGNGIIMGGGLGLMCGASHRIVTESARIAMPEISIGLYPDVGGSYFLNRMPEGCGLFLGLTGASINANDALYVNLADYFVPHDAKFALFERLLSANWQAPTLRQTLDSICAEFDSLHQGQLPEGNLPTQQSWLSGLAQKNTLPDAVNYIQAAPSDNNKWLSKAQHTLSAGSAISAHLVFEQLARGKNMALAECFKMELGLSCKCGEFGEFYEGVRALLIDKDNQPNWRYKSVEDTPQEVVASFFAAPWADDEHPLAHLK